MAVTIAAPAKSRAKPPRPTRGLSLDWEAPPAPVLGAPTGMTPGSTTGPEVVLLLNGVTAAAGADATEVKDALAALTVNV